MPWPLSNLVIIRLEAIADELDRSERLRGTSGLYLLALVDRMEEELGTLTKHCKLQDDKLRRVSEVYEKALAYVAESRRKSRMVGYDQYGFEPLAEAVDRALTPDLCNMTAEAEYNQALKDIFRCFYGSDTHNSNFTSQVLLLIQKADPDNLARLRLAFPETVCAFEDWYNSDNEIEFFKSKGFIT